MPNKNGIDKSTWQGVVNYNGLVAEPITFIASQLGVTNRNGQRDRNEYALDDQYRRCIDQERALGKWKIIHYYVPITRPWQEQLNWIFSAAGTNFPANEAFMFDLEYKHALEMGWPAVYALMEAMEQHLQRPAVFHYGELFMKLDKPERPKWPAHYGSNPATEAQRADMYKRYSACQGLTLWQYTSKGTVAGINALTDLNEILDPVKFNAAFTIGGPVPVVIDYMTKAEWGGAAPKWDAGDQPVQAEYIVIHHGGADHNPLGLDTVAEESQYLRNVQAWAQRPKDQGGKGYSDLDYNIGVGPTGNAYEIRGWYEKSGATLDLNHKSYSILLFGGYTRNKLTTAQREMIAKVIVDGIQKGRLRPGVKIIGHRDNPAHPGATSCPGDMAYAEIPWIRNRVAELQHPIVVPQEDDMYVQALPEGVATFRLGGGTVKWLNGAVPSDVAELNGKTVQKVGLAFFKDYLLVGNVPQGDSLRTWTAADFLAVINAPILPPTQGGTVPPHTHIPGPVA